MDLDHARAVLKAEADALLSVIPRLGESFENAVSLILACQGHVVVTGMGKAGLVGQKVSATFASTGTPSLYLHPAEAYHGDLGRVVKKDLVLALSNSGETDEILKLLPLLKKIGTPLVALTSQADCSLGRLSDVVVETGKISEACPLGLAPSASTTVQMAIGDALALDVHRRRGFSKEEFAKYHPGGRLGRKLQTVGDVMRTNEQNPTIREDLPVREAIGLITKARAGAVSIVDGDGMLTGFFTDGDLRRGMSQSSEFLLKPISEVMTHAPITVTPDQLATEALRFLRDRKVDELPVVDPSGRPVGMLDVQDLLDVDIV